MRDGQAGGRGGPSRGRSPPGGAGDGGDGGDGGGGDNSDFRSDSEDGDDARDVRKATRRARRARERELLMEGRLRAMEELLRDGQGRSGNQALPSPNVTRPNVRVKAEVEWPKFDGTDP